MVTNLPVTEFFVECIPPKSTHQHTLRIFRRGDGKSTIGKSKTNKAAQAERDLFALLHPHKPDSPLDGPLAVKVAWYFPWRKSEPKKNRALGFMPCNVRPDLDNLAKGLFDVMTRLGFWQDDSQISSLGLSKKWGRKTGIKISISYDN